jgi:alkylresorcinol/alkylpyrone synthase
MPSFLKSLSTAVPPYELRTDDVISEATTIFAGRHRDFERMMPVFTNTGIDMRQSVRPYAWFREEQGWPGRTAAFLDGAISLFREAAGLALGRASMTAAGIDHIVSVSSTGIATPSVEAHVLHEMGFRDDVKRTPVFGLGCAGGVSGLSLASQLAHDRNVLLVVIELCTLAFRPDEMTKSNIVATALFGDGAAAAVLGPDAPGAVGEIEHCGEHTWPATLEVMGWRVDAQGFGAIFSRSIPDLVRAELRPAADRFLARHKLALSDVGQFVLHPGGAKVILALEEALGLPDGALASEREMLRLHGNMSAPTVLFVLEDRLKQPFSGRRFLSALGPGFTASFVTMLS